MEDRQVISGELYRHFKGGLYQIVGVAKHSETMEVMVVYQALYGDYSMYVRPLSMFLSNVDHEKYPDVTAMYRFTKVERDSLVSSKPNYLQDLNHEHHDMSLQEQMSQNPKQHVFASGETNSNHRLSAFKEMKRYVPEEVIIPPHPEACLVNEDLMAFLDAKDYAEKLEILYSIRKRIDDRVMSDIEMSLDMPVSQKSIEERIELVRNNLQTMAKFECNRLR